MSNLQSNLSELVAKLEAEGYVLKHRGKYKFTDLFYEILTGIRQGLTRTENGELVVVESKLPAAAPPRVRDWINEYCAFIMSAQVPARLHDSNGRPYPGNKYSDAGLKAYRKALESGVDPSVLEKSVMLYYKSNIAYKKAIGNYMSDGDWRTDYQVLLAAAQTGEAELKKHITNETEGGSNALEWG